MYMIVTSKPGLFRTDIPAEARVIETYDYVFYGRLRAVFQIIETDVDIRLVITEEAPPHIVNRVPSKFLEKFSSLEAARKELRHLTHFGSIEATLMVRPDANHDRQSA